MARGDFNFDRNLNTCFREESPDQPITEGEEQDDAPDENG